jgi:hypothetical protein
MGSFGPCCANAGGVYIESTGTFYTYDRTAQQSTFTTAQLVKHEFGHYLNGRHIFPGIYGEAGYFDQPNLWADEGFAEVLAALEFDSQGDYTLHPHNVHLNAICSSSKPDLNTTITSSSYTSTTYPHGWALSYFLTNHAHDGLLNVFQAYRNKSYNTANFASLAGGASMAAVQASWNAAIDGWCSQPRTSATRIKESSFAHFERPDAQVLEERIGGPFNPIVDPVKPALDRTQF